jgi:uncharacterized membrane protein (DUF373 family)
MNGFIKRFERFVVFALLVMMMIVVFLSTVELAVVLVRQMLAPPLPILLDIDEMLTIFGFFMMILIGLELMETVKVYLVEETVHAEIIFLVAIIAITRKVIILDFTSLEPMNLIGIAAIILALSGGYYMLKKGLKE